MANNLKNDKQRITEFCKSDKRKLTIFYKEDNPYFLKYFCKLLGKSFYNRMAELFSTCAIKLLRLMVDFSSVGTIC